MSDELAIQQQKQGSATPYALGGAVVGGLAGAFSPVGVTKPKYSSYEDILKESEDTFNREISKGGDNKGFWETAKSHANAVQNAEKEYESQVAKIREESKSAVGQLPADNEAAKNLKTAEENYAKALEAEKTKLANRKAASSPTGFLTPDEALKAGVFENTTMQNEYTTRYDAYQKALAKAEKNSKNKKTLTDFEKQVNTYLETLRQKTASGKHHGNNDIDGLVKIIKDNNIIEEITDFSDWKEKGYKSQRHYQTEYQKQLDKSRRALAKEILGDIKDVKVGKKTCKVFTNANGYRNSYNEANNALNDLSKEISDKIKQRASKGKTDLMVIDKSGSITTTPFTNHKQLLTVEEYKKLLDDPAVKKNDNLRNQINILKGFAEKKEKANAEIIASKKSFFKPLSRAQELEQATKQEVENATRKERCNLLGFVNKNKTLQEAMPKSSKTGSAMSAAEIEDAAKAALEKSSVKSKLEAAKTAAEEEAKKIGLSAKELTDDELLKILKEKGLGSKEEYLAKVKKSAQEAIEKDLGKIKGPNKWVNAAIAAAALGLVGLGIGKAVNK